ncbi:hypothetical protein ABZ353_12020 [Streptomyces niveus]|uniref:hypothetical protein n=1 Tax=Streptomyces niveus TaxID=193462 RepID=UPI0033D88194
MQGSDERHGIRRGLRTSAGATAVEYLGTLGVVALVTGAIVATNIGGDIAGYAHEHVCRIVQMGSGTDYSGDVPGDDGERTRSLIEEYGRTFPDTNIIAVKSFNDLSFTGVSGLEHLAVVDGVDVFAIDEGTITNNGDGGWQNWGFTGTFEHAEDSKEVTFKQH